MIYITYYIIYIMYQNKKRDYEKMVTLDPCRRLKTIYYQLVPSIIQDAEDDKYLNTRSVIEGGLEKLEDKSYQLGQKCSNCGKCGKCEAEAIENLFLDTRERLESIWIKQLNDKMHEVIKNEPLLVC